MLSVSRKSLFATANLSLENYPKLHAIASRAKMRWPAVATREPLCTEGSKGGGEWRAWAHI